MLSKKIWIPAILVFAAAAGKTWENYRAGFTGEDIIGPLMAVAVGGIFFLVSLYNLKKGELNVSEFGKTRLVTRKDNPFQFWVAITIFAVLGGGFFLFGLYRIFFLQGA